jgi:hypothetical protein
MSQLVKKRRTVNPLRLRRAASALAMLALTLPAAESQNQQNTQPPAQNPQQHPATNGTAQHPPTPPPAQSKWHVPFFGNHNASNTPNGGTAANPNANANATGVKHFFNNIFHRNDSNGANANNANGNAGSAGLLGQHGLQPNGTAQQHPQTNTPQKHNSLNAGAGSVNPNSNGAVNAMRPAPDSHQMHLATIGSIPGAPPRGVQSQTFLGHPGPLGSTETNRGGKIVRRAADGSVLDISSPKNDMTIHHGLDGSRRVLVDHPDGSHIFAPGKGRAYVEHPYLYQAQPFVQRTFVDQGRVTHQFYRPYNYEGTNLDVYAPQRYYSPAVYHWATTNYSTPQVPAWNYTATPAPWFDYYKGYFQPESSYASPTGWLTDFVLATSLINSYNAHHPPSVAAASAAAAPQGGSASAAAPPPPVNTAPIVSPEVKELVADQVGRQVQQEGAEAKANAAGKPLPPSAGSVTDELNQNDRHVFVVASDLDLVDPSGRRCMISEGDVIEVVSAADPQTSSAQALVLASKGGVECARAARVDVALTDLQEMQNHMRETIDQGMAATNTGKSAPSVTPAFVAAAPPPDENAKSEIDKQAQLAAAVEG